MENIQIKGFKVAACCLFGALGIVAVAPKVNAQNSPDAQQLYRVMPVTPQVPRSAIQYTDDSAAYLKRGMERLNSGNYRGAIADFSRILNTEPENAYANLGNGLAYLHLGRYDTAKAYFDNVLAIDPQNALAYSVRGISRVGLRDNKGAIADLRIASYLFQQGKQYTLAKKTNEMIRQIAAYSRR